MAANVSIGSVGRIVSNSITPIAFALFMLGVTYGAYSMDYLGAAIFFVVITLLSLVVVYRKISNELVRERFSTE